MEGEFAQSFYTAANTFLDCVCQKN